MNKIYRPCAGIVVFNNDGLLFLGNRVGIENSWQFPQGGIEKNETILEAAKRELFEETGIKSVIHVYTEDMPIRYEFNEINLDTKVKIENHEMAKYQSNMITFEEMRREYNRRRRVLVDGFKKMGLDCFEPLGAFYVFPSIKKFNIPSEEFALRLLHEEKVACVPGTAFGTGGEGYLRISYCYSEDELVEALKRIEKFIAKL